MKTSCRVLLFSILTLSACAPNRAIEQSGDNPNANAVNAVSTPTPEPVSQKVTVAELMQRVATAPKDSFLFPCTLNAYSDADRESLKKLRQTWVSKEKDERYQLLSSSACVCPGVCLLKVEDTSKAPPKNSALIVIDKPADNKYFWLAKDIDLERAEISWADTTPNIYFLGPDGKRNGSACAVEKSKESFVLNCTDASGKKLPPPF
jgi:hypothetical protein